jgi:hypothetical protein
MLWWLARLMQLADVAELNGSVIKRHGAVLARMSAKALAGLEKNENGESCEGRK